MANKRKSKWACHRCAGRKRIEMSTRRGGITGYGALFRVPCPCCQVRKEAK